MTTEKTAHDAPAAPKPPAAQRSSDALKRANEARARLARERAEARTRDEAAATAPEQVEGFSIFYPDGVLRYRSDRDGYQTANAQDARNYRHNHG